jgi:plastocyanin
MKILLPASLVNFSHSVRSFACLACFTLTASTFTLSAATTPVTVGDDYFSPSAATINVNDSIKWTWSGSRNHTCTSYSGLWDTGTQGSGYTFTRAFTSAGSFPYHCTIHAPMTGSITVKSLGVTVAISSPANGVSLAAPASFQVKATATTTSGTITNVAFFQGLNLLTNDTLAPYSVNLTDLPVGTYTFSARASDSAGHKATNSIVVHVIADTVKPTVTLQFPIGLQRVTNGLDGSVAIFGTTSDNVGVTNVQVQLNDGPWMPAAMNGEKTVWKIEPIPPAGTNIYRVFATDKSGNNSVTNQARFVDVVRSPLTLITNGSGGISRAFVGLNLEVGRGYTMTGVPGPGQILSSWSGDVSSQSAGLNFIMQSNMTIQVNFIANPFLAAKGVYNGLFSQPIRAQARSGFFTMSLGDHGAYTASARIGTNTYPWSGQFNAYGFAASTVAVGGQSVPVALSVDLSDNETLTGTIGQADVTAYRAVFSATNPATAYMGKYTLIIPGLMDSSVGPGGNGAATVVVGPGGNATISGFAGDGRTLSKIVPLSSGGFAPFYQDLYAGHGSMWSWLQFNTNVPTDQISGDLSWIKPVLPGAVLYPHGFTNDVKVAGSPYAQPAAGTRVINLSSGTVVFEGGNLAIPFTNVVNLTTNNRVVNGSANTMNFSITLSNGTFAGSVKVPGTTKTNAFKGALLQDSDAGYGWFLGTDQSGSVSLQSP